MFEEDSGYDEAGSIKEMMIIPGAVHTDLYYKLDAIPFDKIQRFFEQHLKQAEGGNP